MTAPLIRPAQLADIPHVLRHRRAMYWDMGKRDEEALRRMLISAEAFLRDAMSRGDYHGWLAEAEDGRIVSGTGLTIVPWPGSPDEPEPRRAWVHNVYTEPEFRHRGLARRLMQAAIEWCREQGFVNLSLHASDEGRPLYESMGFVQTNEMRLRLR
jgi:GNAT superfamily N-acetyltransferase